MYDLLASPPPSLSLSLSLSLFLFLSLSFSLSLSLSAASGHVTQSSKLRPRGPDWGFDVHCVQCLPVSSHVRMCMCVCLHVSSHMRMCMCLLACEFAYAYVHVFACM